MAIFCNQTVKSIVSRYAGGWRKKGFVQHPTDTRTAAEIKTNLEVYAEKMPEVQKFIKELKQLSPQHMTLASDIIERSNEKLFLMTDINLKKQYKGKSPLERLLADVIEADKTNPEALSFLHTVLNNTDSLGAKVALYEMSGGILKNKEVAKQFEASKDLIPMIGKQTLDGGYTGTFEKEKTFMDFIKVLINPHSQPEKIKLFKEVQTTADSIENIKPIYIDSFVQSDTPVSTIKNNLKTLPDVANLFKSAGKELNTTEYLTKNVNLY